MIARRTLLAAAVAASALRPARAQTGVLRFGLSAFPPNLQPWVSTGSSASAVKMLIVRGLLGYGAQGELAPELAQSWSADDQGRWTFRLRPDARFHNAEPVTADDVKWTIEQAAGEKSTATLRAQLQMIERVEALDPATVRLTTKQPIVTLPHWFANPNMGVLWRKSEANAPIGCGPFRLVGQERGTSLDLAAAAQFYKPGLPRLRGVKFVVYADENLRTAALQAGDVDMIEYVPWQSMTGIEANPKLAMQSVDGPFMDLLFNGARGPFSDARVRRAVAHAIRREDIVKAAFLGRGSALAGVPIAPGTPFYDEKLANGWAYDPARARALLAQAGVPNGFSTTLLSTAQFGMHKDTAEVVQQHLAEIGIMCELRLPDWSTRVAQGMRGQYEIAVHGNTADNNDPDGVSNVLDTSLANAYGRSFELPAPRTVALLAKGRAEFDQAKRVAIYRDMQAAALEEVPMVGLAWRSQAYAWDRKVTGFANMPGALTFNSPILLDQVATSG